MWFQFPSLLIARALAALPDTATDAGQHIGRMARRRTGDDTSRRGIDSRKTQTTDSNGMANEQKTSVTRGTKRQGW